MIEAMENFKGCDVRCCCVFIVFDGDVFIIDGDEIGDTVIDCVLLAAVSMIGLFDVSGTPVGLCGCIPDEIYKMQNGSEVMRKFVDFYLF